MKTAICIVLLAALGCNTDTNNRQSITTKSSAITTPASFKWQPGNTPEGKWRLIPAMPSDTAAGRIPVLKFMVQEERVTGNTGCNNFSGTFNIDKNNLTFNHDFVSTKMACPGYDEVTFEKNLLRTNNFEINGDTLVLKVNQIPLSYWIKAQ